MNISIEKWYDTGRAPNATIENPQPYNKIGEGPEASEVYVMTTRFARRFPPGHRLTSVQSLCDRYTNGVDAIPDAFIDALPLKITTVTSKGKKTVVKFNKDWALLVSYGMTGHWETSTSKHAQLEFGWGYPQDFADKYYWVSSRSLPTCVVQFISHTRLQTELDKLGLDIIRDDPEPEQVLEAFGKSRKNISAFIMEQAPFAGVGNYVKSMVLYRCRISPHRKCHELDDDQKWLIWATAKEVAKEAVAAKGMGMRDYKDECGKRVGVAFDVTPYGKKQDHDGNEVLAENIAGRTTWWVPAVQK